MVKNQMYLIIIGKDQVYTDMPEYRNHPNPAYQNERVRGTGGQPTSFGEENLLSLPLDRYDDESIGVHEFCHTIDGALRSHRSDLERAAERSFRNAIDKGPVEERLRRLERRRVLGRDLPVVLRLQPRQQLEPRARSARASSCKAYDPEGYELVRTTFNLSPEQDWRYASAAEAAERHPAAGEVQDRSLLHEVHLGARVHRSSAARRATKPCSRPTTRSARCSPIATTSSKR